MAGVLSGCGAAIEGTDARDASGAEMRGKVFGGQQPVAGSTVSLWQMGTSGYGMGAAQLASTVSDGNGNFQFASNAYTCPYSNVPVYVLASGGNAGSGSNPNLVLAAGLGTCSAGKSAIVNINEVSTVVTAFALSHFFTTTMGGGYTTDLFGGTAAGAGSYNVGIVRANSSTIPTVLNVGLGQVNSNTSVITLEAAKINSLANVLAACVNSSGQSGTSDTTSACGMLFGYTTVGSNRPLDTLQAAVRIALSPYANVSGVYGLVTASAPFVGLSQVPNDWTIGVSYSAPTFGLGINGGANWRTSSTMDIDASGNVWFPTNALASHGLAYFSPVTQSFNGPYAVGLVHPQYVSITSQGVVFGSDLAAAQLGYVTASSPTTLGTFVATTGFTGALTAGYSSSTLDGVFFTGGGSATGPGAGLYEYASSVSAVTTFAKPPNGLIAYTTVPYVDASTGASTTVCSYESYLGSQSVRVSTANSPCFAGGMANLTSYQDGVMAVTSSNQLCDYYGTCFTAPVALNAPESVALDGDGRLWIANSGGASVSTLGYAAANSNASDFYATSSVPYLHDASNGATMLTPFGIAIDRSGNVWVSNASCISTTSTACVPNGFVLSELIGAAAPTLTPLALSNVGGLQGKRPSVSGTSSVVAPMRRR